MINKTHVVFCVISLIGLILLSSCEKELYENAISKNNTNGKMIIEDFSLKNKSESVSSSLLDATKNFKNLNGNNPQNRIIYDSINNFYYDDTSGKHMQLDEKHSYTFPVLRSNSDGKIENLVFNQKIDGTFETFLIKYDVTETALDTLSVEQFREKEVILDQIGIVSYFGCYCPVLVENPRYFRTSDGTIVPVNNLFDVVWEPCPCSEASGSTNPGTSGDSPGPIGSTTGSSSTSGGSSGANSGSGTIMTIPVSTNTDNNGTQSDYTITQTPCGSLRDLANPNRGAGNIKPFIDSLKTQVNSANNYVELGFSTKRNNDPTDGSPVYTTSTETSNNNSNIDLPFGGSFIGGGHTHPVNAYPMFSFGDLTWLAQAYSDASTGRKNDVFYMLVCKNKATGIVHTYALKVTDIANLTNSINTTLNVSDFTQINDLKDRIEEIHKKQAIRYSNCNDNYEGSFLSQFPNFGISLYSTNDTNLLNWNLLNLSNVLTVTSNPCNN